MKTRVIKNNCNPTWNEEMTLFVKNVETPIQLVSSFIQKKKCLILIKENQSSKTYT